MRALRLLLAATGLLAVAGPVACADELRMAALEWPPYVTPELPANGLTAALASAVLARLGSHLSVDYFPWKRTMEFGLHNPDYDGFMPVWRTPEREKICYFSTALGRSQPVLAYLKSAPVSAPTLADLRGVRVGTVAGYSNGEQFDRMVRAGLLHVEEGVSDETNLRKLLGGRFPAMVVEKYVLRYLLAGPEFHADRARIAVDSHLFGERTVHLCFQRTPEGHARQRAFNEAARELDLPKLERDYWRRLGEDAATGN
jgi:polar amino acid transport system substrate-binding protein